MAIRIFKKDAKRTDTTTLEHSDSRTVGENEIALRAYQIWQERGCPSGSDGEDWRQAEEELRHRQTALA